MDEREPPPELPPDAIVGRAGEEPAERGSRASREPGRPRGPGWITWVALAVGLGLSLLLTRHGVFFFFLPIILPFGLGGGSFLRRTISRNRR